MLGADGKGVALERPHLDRVLVVQGAGEEGGVVVHRKAGDMFLVGLLNDDVLLGLQVVGLDVMELVFLKSEKNPTSLHLTLVDNILNLQLELLWLDLF